MKKAILLLLVFLTSVHLSAQGMTAMDRAYYAGQDNRLFELMTAYVQKNPRDLGSLLYTRDILTMDYIKPASWYVQFVENYIKRLSSAKGDNTENMVLQLSHMLEEFSYTHRITEVYPSVSEGFYMEKWKIYDPFREYGDYDFLSDDLLSRGSSEKYRMSTLKSADGSIHLDSYIYQTDGIVKAQSTLYSPTSVCLRIRSNCEYRAYINNTLVLENSFYQKKRDLRIIETDNKGVFTLSLMIKNQKDGYFSVMTTDRMSHPVSCTPSRDKESLAIGGREVYDFPLNTKPENTPQSLYRYGWFLSTYKSIECYDYYQKSLNLSYNPVVDFSYAHDLIHIPSQYRWSSSEGWKRIHTMRKGYPTFIPLRYYTAWREMKSGRYTEAEEELSPAEGRVSFSCDLIKLSLMDQRGSRTRFINLLNKFEKKYPNSIHQNLIAARFWEKYDNAAYEKYAETYLYNIRSENTAFSYFKHANKMGSYEKGLSYAEEYIDAGRYSFVFEYLSSLINRGLYAQASAKLIQYSVLNNSPLIQYLMGLNQQRQGLSPDLYWQKIEGGDIDTFFPRDYLNADEDRISVTSLEDAEGRREEIRHSFFEGANFNSTYPYIFHTYILYSNMKAHFGCDQLIYIKNDRDISTFGEYKIPFATPSIIKARIYYRDGSYSDSQTIQLVSGSTYITLNGLTKDSLVHLSYESLVASNLPGSSFFLQEPVLCTGYDQALDTFVLRVSSPGSMNISIASNYDQIKEVSTNSLRTMKELTIENIGEIKKENANGSPERYLPWYQISSTGKGDTYLSWLEGKSYHPLPPTQNTSFQERVVSSVYQEVLKRVKEAPFTSMVPNPAQDTLYFESGSEGDRVYLCRELLAQKGITSYPCIVHNPFVSKERIETESSYYGMLLYIPDVDGGIFLDFSSRYIGTGALSPAYSGERGYLLFGGKGKREDVTISSPIDNGEEINAEIDCSNNSCSLNIRYKGYDSWIRSYFQDSRYADDYISQLLGSFRQNMLYTGFSFSGLSDNEEPFDISTKGSIPSYANRAKDLIIIQPYLRDSDVHSYITDHTRKQDLFISEEINTKDSYTVTIPPEFSGSAVNDSITLQYKEAVAEFTIYKKSDSPILVATERISIPKMTITPADYAEFQNFVKGINLWEKKTVTLNSQ